ncbi:MAG: hypothetical protein IPH26_18365 [Sterolibacteriaceae bacterium]|uniref:Uncharacterized protein n=1 Tax=Candidatus Methylophosphatis roskildensis TaxID=2899263 RepID=A0A9D7E6N8_9PROT|nr:hypothetical protein [Candidatus Methylophosphatis roskildensis]
MPRAGAAGVVMLGLAAVLVALFFVAYLRNQIGSLLETRKLLKEVQRAHDLPSTDQAEESRIENLHRLISTEFSLAQRPTGRDRCGGWTDVWDGQRRSRGRGHSALADRTGDPR